MIKAAGERSPAVFPFPRAAVLRRVPKDDPSRSRKPGRKCSKKRDEKERQKRGKREGKEKEKKKCEKIKKLSKSP